jgi:rhodanese-related sulfurtransferase/uncharacterized membrane protein YphA (DoxX/SURF4 family)
VSNTTKYIVLALRIILGGVFIMSAAPKILALPQFAKVVESYHMVPAGLVTPFAYTLPWVELVVGIMLVLGIWVGLASFAASVLMFLFMAVIGFSLARGTMPADCGCYGLAEIFGGSGPETLIRDIPLFLISLVVLFFERGAVSVLPKKISASISSYSPAAALGLGVLTVAMLGGSFFYGASLASANGATANGQVKIISVAEVKALLDSKADFVLVDVRAEQDYKEGHVPGAISIPLHLIKDRAGELPKNKDIVVYCESNQCGSSRAAVQQLLDLGFSRVSDMKDGIWGWEGAGYQTQ